MNILGLSSILGLILACTLSAQAHAFLDHSEPKVGETVKGSPASVKIWFTMDLEDGACSIKVFNAKGQEVEKDDVKLDAADKSLLVVSLPKSPPGTYKVTWNVVAVCGHHTEGAFDFVVAMP